MNGLNYKQWEDLYLPIENSHLIYPTGLERERLPLKGIFFGKTYLEQAKVNTFPENQIWSVICERGDSYIIPGFVNRANCLGNVITINPWIDPGLYIAVMSFNKNNEDF